jgi:opacity protein-like surface antigen
MPKKTSLRAALALGVLCLVVSPASAQDSDGGVLLFFDLEQRFEAGDNVDLDVPSQGSTTSAVTRLGFGLSSITPIDRLEISASSALVVERTPDSDGTEIELGRPDATFSYVREIPDARLALTARFRRDDVDAFDDDLDDDDDEGTRTDYGLGLSYDFGRTAPLGFGIDAGYDRTEYENTIDPDLNDVEILRLGLEARLRLSEVLTSTGGLSYVREDEDDAAQTLTETITTTVGLQYLASPRLGLTASVGWTEIETTEFGVTDRTSGPVAQLGLDYTMPNGNATADLVLTTDSDEGDRVSFEVGRTMELPNGALAVSIGVTSADDAGTDVIGALDWTRNLPDGAIGINLARAVRYDDDDDETKVDTSFTIDWMQEINPLSSIRLDLSYEISDAPSERIEQAAIGATYSYALTPDWNLDSGVRYRVRDDAGGRADSPTVFVALGRSFEFRP